MSFTKIDLASVEKEIKRLKDVLALLKPECVVEGSSSHCGECKAIRRDSFCLGVVRSSTVFSSVESLLENYNVLKERIEQDQKPEPYRDALIKITAAFRKKDRVIEKCKSSGIVYQIHSVKLLPGENQFSYDLCYLDCAEPHKQCKEQELRLATGGIHNCSK